MYKIFSLIFALFIPIPKNNKEKITVVNYTKLFASNNKPKKKT